MDAILWSRVECRTVSKTLLKSRVMTTAYELHESSSVTDWRMATIAAVVDPVGRKAYSSVQLSWMGGSRIAG